MNKKKFILILGILILTIAISGGLKQATFKINTQCNRPKWLL